MRFGELRESTGQLWAVLAERLHLNQSSSPRSPSACWSSAPSASPSSSTVVLPVDGCYSGGGEAVEEHAKVIGAPPPEHIVADHKGGKGRRSSRRSPPPLEVVIKGTSSPPPPEEYHHHHDHQGARRTSSAFSDWARRPAPQQSPISKRMQKDGRRHSKKPRTSNPWVRGLPTTTTTKRSRNRDPHVDTFGLPTTTTTTKQLGILGFTPTTTTTTAPTASPNKKVSKYCQLICSTDPSKGGTLCHCDEPPMYEVRLSPSPLAEKLNIDPQRRVCTFRLKVLLTTLTVCGMLFGAAGFAVLGRGGGNAMHRGSFLSQPKVIDGAELQEMMVKEAHFGPLSVDNKRDHSRNNQPHPKAVTTKDLLNALGKNSHGGGGVTPCPPGRQLVKQVVTEEIASDGLNGGSLLSYSSRLICKVPKGLPWFMKGSTTARPKNALKIKTADARNAKKPHPKILKKTTTTKRPANSRSTPFRGRPKTRGLLPPHHQATTKHPKGKVAHHQQVHVGSRKATTPRRRPPSLHRMFTTKRPKWKVTFPPRIFRHPSTPKLPFSVREWKQLQAKIAVARYCARTCAKNPSDAGHLCHCDDPPMEVVEPRG
ncbi:hypothetical protein TYRP_010313 [Tyrophagus putrescentiae]|nr:hypothetical protein TYRP_010313 [Tyrophagus putrescentiae]